MLDDQGLTQLIRRISALEAQMRRPAAELPARSTGTYVPTYLGGTTPGVTTYAYQVGSWQRVGAWIQGTASPSGEPTSGLWPGYFWTWPQPPCACGVIAVGTRPGQ